MTVNQPIAVNEGSCRIRTRRERVEDETLLRGLVATQRQWRGDIIFIDMNRVQQVLLNCPVFYQQPPFGIKPIPGFSPTTANTSPPGTVVTIEYTSLAQQ
ncbi:MAG: hypothetical protein V7707_03955 [Motiliproteus sp.]